MDFEKNKIEEAYYSILSKTSGALRDPLIGILRDPITGKPYLRDNDWKM